MEKAIVKPSFIILLSALAAVSFIFLFGVWGTENPGFWRQMSCTILLLLSVGILADRTWISIITQDLHKETVKKIVIGLLSAIILYGIFLAGYFLSRLVFPFAESNINAVYSLKTNMPEIQIVMLMLFIIGPGEELFWRGFLQRTITDHGGAFRGLLITTLLYAGVHAASSNIMLVIAAFVAGTFWGILYLRYRSILLNIVSHTAWDLLVFIILPFSNNQ